MENLNAEQIIKALEHCINRKDCSDCVIKSKEFRSGCIGRPRAFFKNALSLIKELTEENERLHASCMELTRKMQDNVRAENEVLQKSCECDVRKLKADTVKKMQERLQSYFGTYVLGYKIPLSEALKAVNQIAKEMLEGEK